VGLSLFPCDYLLIDVLCRDAINTSERYEVLSYPSSVIKTICAILTGEDAGVPRNPMEMGKWRTGYIRR
jgi:hypothetical protein